MPGVVPWARNQDQGRAVTRDRASGWQSQQRPRPGSYLPGLNFKAQRPAKRADGNRRTQQAGTLSDRFCVSSAPVGLSQDSPPPLLPGPGPPPRSTPTWQPQPRPAGRHFRVRRLAPPTRRATCHGTSGSCGRSDTECGAAVWGL